MRFVHLFAVMFTLAACVTTSTNTEAPTQPVQPVQVAQPSPAPEPRTLPVTKQSKLTEHLRKDPHLSVKQLNDGSTLLVQVLSGDSFQSDNVSPTPVLAEVLDYIIEALISSGGKYEIKAVGHTDNVGSQQANAQVSERRALAVVHYLANRGLDRQLLSHEGRGSLEPIADNSSQEGRDVNRRVDLLIRPVQSKRKCLFLDCID